MYLRLIRTSILENPPEAAVVCRPLVEGSTGQTKLRHVGHMGDFKFRGRFGSTARGWSRRSRCNIAMPEGKATIFVLRPYAPLAQEPHHDWDWSPWAETAFALEFRTLERLRMCFRLSSAAAPLPLLEGPQGFGTLAARSDVFRKPLVAVAHQFRHGVESELLLCASAVRFDRLPAELEAVGDLID